MNPPAAPSPNRALLWLIFGALMLIAGLQLIPLRGPAREWLGVGCLAVAGLVLTARLVGWLMKEAVIHAPAPLTGRNDQATPPPPAGKDGTAK